MVGKGSHFWILAWIEEADGSVAIEELQATRMIDGVDSWYTHRHELIWPMIV